MSVQHHVYMFFIHALVISLTINMQAYEYNIRYPRYLFLFLGWFVDKWWIGTPEEQEGLRQSEVFNCTAEQRESVLPYSLAPLQAEFLEDQDLSTVTSSGIVSQSMFT